ncbi:hypothetical protein BFJ72_g6850 [Fusarium proliferatum]|uniref:Uncharacterized protein n=1 Tax=Gibberella intermedia TaxID=948311 RepID=A0A420TCW6_GIBIN|nr:hypothetical protein BFJ72_g6850 [Fusarium proliferatum]
MSSAPPRIGDTGNSKKRQRVDEHDPPENKDAVRIAILTDENKALTDEVSQLKQALEEAKNAISAGNQAEDALKVEINDLKSAEERAKAEMESMRLALAEAANVETRQRYLLELVEKHNYEIKIPATGHTQVMRHFKPLVASDKEEDVNRLLDFIYFGSPGNWYCFREIREKGTRGVTSLRARKLRPIALITGKRVRSWCINPKTPPSIR